MVTMRGIRTFCGVLVLIVASCTQMNMTREIKANEERAVKIIRAIERYKQDHDHPPENLADLVPVYLPEIPQTITGQDYAYTISSIDGYLLCFDLVRYQDRSCCFLERYSIWDCSPGE